MVRKQHKFLCLVLCLMLVLASVLVGTFSAFAASGDTVYVKLNNGWSEVYCYMWNGNGETKNADWPGQSMTKVDGTDNVYSYTLPADYANVIFNNHGQGAQTGDMSYPGDGQIYDLSANAWSAYDQAATRATTATAPTTATTPVEQPTTKPATPSTGGTTVYLKNAAGWSTVNCYMWNSSSDTNSGWPGQKMTLVGDDVWMYAASKQFANCIFNDGGTQTGDLIAQDGYIFDNSTNSWSVYDTSDLQVKSYEADPASGIFPETEVTLKAVAANKNGAAVSYKFSVTNASGGTSVISDYSALSTVAWTPAAAGDYTVTFDFKDAEGNENSRQLSLKVEDDSALAKPVIKSVTPANLNLVKRNSNTTVSVKAGGGKTGTNLLFYKYVVTDPNGVQNTPYYTLNSTYTFTPTLLGNYSVNVYVQGSDNSTVNRTYTYTVTDSDIPAPTTLPVPVVPTTTAPVPATTAPVPATTATTPTVVPPVTDAVTPATTAPSTVLRGDANGDGKVNIVDATYVQKHVALYSDAKEISLEAADMNNDGIITIVDATAIQKYITTLR